MIDGKLKREDIDDEEFDGLNNSNERLKRIIELKNKLYNKMEEVRKWR